MGRSVEVVVSELHSAAARLTDAGQRLQDGLSAVDLEVGQLLGSGWKGGAASAFGNEWDKWHGGARQVVRGLQTMSELLTVAGKEYAKTDEQAAQAVSSSFHGTEGSGGNATGGQSASPSGNGYGGGFTASRQGGGATGDLAQQMNLGQSMTAPVSQLGQAVTGAAQQAAQAMAGAVQAAGGLAQQAAQAAQSAQSNERDGDTEQQRDAAGPDGQSGSTAPAPVEPSRPAPQSGSEGDDSTAGSRLPGK
jgi:WXG100 family type VII secretion target